MSYVQSIYHIVLRTKYSEPTLSLENSHLLYRYMWGIIKRKKCILYRINGVEDHIHLLVDLHPTVSVSHFIQDLKVVSSLWLKSHPDFPLFRGWCRKYAAISCAQKDKYIITNYIKNQRVHHQSISSTDEFNKLILD